jgi:hypothetical protein
MSAGGSIVSSGMLNSVSSVRNAGEQFADAVDPLYSHLHMNRVDHAPLLIYRDSKVAEVGKAPVIPTRAGSSSHVRRSGCARRVSTGNSPSPLDVTLFGVVEAGRLGIPGLLSRDPLRNGDRPCWASGPPGRKGEPVVYYLG